MSVCHAGKALAANKYQEFTYTTYMYKDILVQLYIVHSCTFMYFHVYIFGLKFSLELLVMLLDKFLARKGKTEQNMMMKLTKMSKLRDTIVTEFKHKVQNHQKYGPTKV